LRREGYQVNRKRVQRLYRLENLAVRRKPRKRLANSHRQPLMCPTQPNVQWAMDFTSDQLADRRRFRTFNVVDVFTRECLAIEVASSLPANHIIRRLDQVAELLGAPQRITVDNGPEFISHAMDAWAYRHGITLDFIQPGKPMQNGFIESFNGSFRDECLNRHYFLNLEDARLQIEAYQTEYNTFRPHSSLSNLTPVEFKRAHEQRHRRDLSTPLVPPFDATRLENEVARPTSKAGAASKAPADLGSCNQGLPFNQPQPVLS
jgi:putative transposase